LPLIQWTIIRLVVSENDWRRHNSEMEPKRRGKPSPLCTGRRSKTLGLRKATLRSRIHVQEVGLNVGGKGPASSRRGGFSLDIPLYRTFPVAPLELSLWPFTLIDSLAYRRWDSHHKRPWPNRHIPKPTTKRGYVSSGMRENASKPIKGAKGKTYRS
jgi:hypothetical protein